MPAPCGAEADVPKKLGNASPSNAKGGEPRFTEVLPPFGVQMSGLFLGLISPWIRVPPTEENDALVGALTPNAGVLRFNTAPHVTAPAEFAWPTMVEFPVLNSLITNMLSNEVLANAGVGFALKITYLNRILVPVPDSLVTKMLVEVGWVTLKESISKGSRPILLVLKPKSVMPLS